MIEKLKNNATEKQLKNPLIAWDYKIANKINEIIEVVNRLQKTVEADG